MASVILPTREWTSACSEVAAQLADGDELVVVCDSETDPVYGRDAGPDVRILAAGEPAGCSGKANAVARGLETAGDELVICTDDDFAHGDGWLECVREGARRHGAVSTIPFFRSEGAFGALLDAPVLLFGAVIFATGDEMWGGTLAFHRSDVDEDALCRDLRRTVSDDVLIGEHVGDPHVDRALARAVPIEGSPSDLVHRSVRFVRTTLFSDPLSIVLIGIVSLALCVATLLPPLATAVAATAVSGVGYAALGFRRWTFLLAFPGFLLAIGFVLYGLAQPEFEWGGRRYRWRRQFDVEIVERSE